VINKYILQVKRKGELETKKNLHEKNLRATAMSNLMSGDPSRYTNVSKKDTDFNNRVQVNTTEGSKPSLTNSKG